MGLQAITTNGPTITVTNGAELKDAYYQLSNTPGGGQILMEGGDYGWFNPYRVNFPDGGEPVVMSSADPGDPAKFSMIFLREAENIRIEGVHVDSTGSTRADWYRDLHILDSENIQIVDSVFTHDLNNSLKDSGERVEMMSLITRSDGVLFEGNYIDGYFHGLAANEMTNSEFINNEFTNLQGDGFRGGGLQDVSISNNYMHDFYGSDQSLNHSDLIQIWGADSNSITKNLTISGNILMSGDLGSQSIFIRNEEFGKEGDSTNGYFENITITNNLIYNAHRWGIHVDNVDGAYVANNTVLHNQETDILVRGETKSDAPEIFARRSLDIVIENNIAGRIVNVDTGTTTGNQIVNFTNPGADNYVGNHFVNPFEGVDATPADLMLKPGSAWVGTGSSYTWPGNTPDVGQPGNLNPVVVDVPVIDDPDVANSDADPAPGGGQSSGGGAQAPRTTDQAEDDSQSQVAEDDGGGSKNFLAKLFEILFSIFGLGRDDDDEPVVAAQDSQGGRAAESLSDVVPIVGAYDDTLPGDEDDDVFDVAA